MKCPSCGEELTPYKGVRFLCETKNCDVIEVVIHKRPMSEPDEWEIVKVIRDSPSSRRSI